VNVAILNGMDDLGETVHMHELYTERYVVIFPPDHSMSASDVIRLADLSD
jgi:hypothetical protein